MRAAALLALAALAGPALLAHPLMAQDRVATETRYTPDPLWFRGNGVLLTGRGDVRVVTGPQGSAALTVNQYMEWEAIYRAALARLSFRMPVARADPLARQAALDAILARYRVERAATLPVRPVVGPDLTATPIR